jgi:hypothetical protein
MEFINSNYVSYFRILSLFSSKYAKELTGIQVTD